MMTEKDGDDGDSHGYRLRMFDTDLLVPTVSFLRV
jgi:hypothetical protein